MSTEHQQAYGLDDIAVFAASVKDSPLFGVTGPGIAIISILSDAQELIDAGQGNAARQYINRAKYLIHYFKLGLPTP